MHAIACLFAWLLLPLLERELRSARDCAASIFIDLIDPATGAAIDRPRDFFLRADRLLRAAHMFLDHVIATRACRLAGLPAPKRNRLPSLGRHYPARAALLKRAAEVLTRADNFERNAQRLAQRMRQDPLRFAASQLATSPGSAGGGKKAALTVGMFASTAYAGEVACARLRAQDGGGRAIRAPP